MDVTLSSDLFREIPVAAEVSLIAVIFFVGNFLNILVVKFYRKVDSSCRRYVLFLSLLDFLSLSFVMAPRVVLRFLNPGTPLYVLNLAMYFLRVLIFNVYMYGPFFLALNRFLVVRYPHNFHDKRKFVKAFMFVLPPLHILNTCLLLPLKMVFGRTSDVVFVVSNLNNVFKAVQILGCALAYIVVALQIWSTEEKMSAHKHTGSIRSASGLVHSYNVHIV